jgi:cytochrome c-type biogenesis protein CcmH/NrfF
MLKELDQHVASGEADDLIVQDFVQEYGVQVLSAPPNTGFNRVAWLMPGIAFAIGLGIVMVVIASWRHKARPASAVNIEVSSEARARAREAANRETED